MGFKILCHILWGCCLLLCHALCYICRQISYQTSHMQLGAVMAWYAVALNLKTAWAALGGEFSAQRASNKENVSISWHHHNLLPEACMAIGYCRCLRLSVRPCVNHLLVRAITRNPFKLGSPNFNHRCKRPWLRSLLFWGVIDLYLQGQINLRSQNLPHFELVRPITHHSFKLGPPNLDQLFKIPRLRSLLFWGLIELDMSNLT